MSLPVVTICMQTRGNRFDSFQRCLTSIIQHTPAGAYELRLGFVQAADSLHHTIGMLNNRTHITRDLLPGKVERFSWNEETDKAVYCWHATTNFPRERMTRLLFGDVPPVTEYLVSFDDDSYVAEGWWEALLKIMERKIDYFGHPRWIEYLPDQIDILKSQLWYTGIPVPQRQNRPICEFMSGFFAVRADRLRGFSLPDGREAWRWERYRHYGSDMALGEMARQQNWTHAPHTQAVCVREDKI